MSFTSLNNLQAAILEKNSTLALPDIKPNNRISPQAQINIYVEGYRLRLLAAIRSDYQETIALVGDKEFDALALEFIEQTPSDSYNLDFYPHKFAEFVADKLDSEAYQVILKEQAIAICFMGKESEPFNVALLAKLSPEEFGNLIFRPRIASKLLSNIYIYRHNNEVQKVALKESEYLLLNNLFNGLSVSNAIEELINNYPHYEAEIAENITNWFSIWAAKGFFRNYSNLT